MANKIPIWDMRMLQLMDDCIKFKQRGIKNQNDFIDALGIPARQTLKQIREGKQSFKHQHILNASKKFDISIDWIYGVSENMHLVSSKISPVDMIKDGLRILEKQAQTKRPLKRNLKQKTA